jgi:dihydroxy-acid dehydratase
MGHVAPEAQVGGPIALLHEGDIVTIDSVTQEISFQVTQEELEKRSKDWTQPPLKYTTGVLAKYAKLVSSASKGAVTDLFE